MRIRAIERIVTIILLIPALTKQEGRLVLAMFWAILDYAFAEEIGYGPTTTAHPFIVSECVQYRGKYSV